MQKHKHKLVLVEYWCIFTAELLALLQIFDGHIITKVQEDLAGVIKYLSHLVRKPTIGSHPFIHLRLIFTLNGKIE